MADTLPNWAEIVPAYGRDFKNARDAKDYFVAGHDWKYAVTGQYCSIRDVAPGNTVILRYRNIERTTNVTVTMKMLSEVS